MTQINRMAHKYRLHREGQLTRILENLRKGLAPDCRCMMMMQCCVLCGGEGAPPDIETGGARGSGERGDRSAEERQKRVQAQSEGKNEKGA